VPVETLAKQIADRRLEIAQADALMMQAVFLIFALCMASYVAATLSGKTELHKLVLVLVVTLPFFIARQEYMIHRPAEWIKTVQASLSTTETTVTEKQIEKATVQNWEAWKDSRYSTYVLLPLLDILAGLTALYVLYCSSAVLWPTDKPFVLWSGVGVIVGILSCIAGAKLAGK
jgi:hypothetical protein